MWIMLLGLYVDSRMGVFVYDDVVLVVKVLIDMVLECMLWGIDWLYLMQKMDKLDDVSLLDVIVGWIGWLDWQQWIFVMNLVKLYGFVQCGEEVGKFEVVDEMMLFVIGGYV